MSNGKMTSPRSFYASGCTSIAKIFGWSFSRLQHSDSNDPDWVRELTKDKMILNGLSIDNGMLWACHELGHYSQGKLVEAEQMYQQALQGFEKALGPDHTSALGAVNGLGLLCANQGKLVKAERVYQRALRGYEKALGADNIIT
ncbi:hypothetical protein DL95DRAFT_415111 [Leptodontidium sp. 2 PMI_412]|nr:hypothetical protein DL95DRAFT_415111 [Leptodontidium sp. 2 PMI_412]